MLSSRLTVPTFFALSLFAFACSKSGPVQLTKSKQSGPETSVAGFLASDAATHSELSPYENELAGIFETVRNHYGPLELKRETIGLDFENAQKKAYAELSNMRSSNDLSSIIAHFLNSLNDAHVSVSLPTNLVYSLPFQLSAVEGKIIVNYVDRAKLPSSACNLKPGDTLLRLNGKTPAEIQASDPVFRKYGNDRTNLSFFARMLTNLKQSSGLPLASFASDTANLEFARYVDPKEVIKCKIAYEKTGTGFISRPIKDAESSKMGLVGGELGGRSAFSAVSEIPEFLKDPRFLRMNASLENWHRLVNTNSGVDLAAAQAPAPGTEKPTAEKSEGKRIELASKMPFFTLPADFKEIKPSILGRPLMALAGSFYAGTFTRNGKRIGFLRVPSYMPAIAALIPFGIRFYLSELEAKSDMLIIDQTNNPGGAVVMSDLLVKGLTGKFDTSKHMQFKMKPTQRFLRTYTEILASLEQMEKDDLTLTSEQKKYFTAEFKKNFDLLNDAFQKGESLSQPISLAVLSEFFEIAIDQALSKLPAKGVIEKLVGGKIFSAQTYTKPVYMMINELDFSGGDATPATLQDYGRVKLVGVRTSGAGGTVEEFESRITSDIKFRLTTSLMYRKNGKYVENYGVTPDIAFELKTSDYREGFTGVFERMLSTLGI